MLSLCTLPTLWSSSSTRHSGTCPTGSLELVPQYRTRTSPTKLDYRVTSQRYHRHTVLGIPVVRCPSLPPEPLGQLLATTTLWQTLSQRGLPGKHYGCRDYHHLPDQ